MRSRSKVAALATEFLGTAILSSAVLALILRTSFPFFTAAAAAIVYSLMYLSFVKYSGSHLNPALTLSLWIMRKIPSFQALAYMAAQFLGGAIALLANTYLIGQSLPQLASGEVRWEVLLSEVLGAFIFTFSVIAAVYQRYVGGYLAALVGFAVAIGMIVASVGSNGLINPALALGVNSFGWAYVVGPLLGGVLGAAVYGMIYSPLEIKLSQKRR